MYGGCPWGVLEVLSGTVGAIYTKFNVGLMETPNFGKLADFPCVHVEIGRIRPHMAKHAFGGQMGTTICKTPCPLAVPPS